MNRKNNQRVKERHRRKGEKSSSTNLLTCFLLSFISPSFVFLVKVCHSKALWSLRVLCTVGVVAAVGPAIAVSPIALAVFGFVRLHKTYNLVERHE